MSYFNVQDETVYSPKKKELEGLFIFLEKYSKVLSGSQMYDELLEIYTRLDYDLIKDIRD